MLGRFLPQLAVNAKWRQNGVIVAGGHGKGSELNQLSAPRGLYVDDEQTIFIADFGNHRVVECKCGAASGQVVAGENGLGYRTDQLNQPTAVILDTETNSLIIGEYKNQRVMRWPRESGTSRETIFSNINCYGLTMEDERSLYVCDYDKHEVRRYRAGESDGTVLAGGHGKGDGLNQLNDPTHLNVMRKQGKNAITSSH